MLGHEYAAISRSATQARLAWLVLRCRDDAQFYRLLAQDCRARRALFAPSRERVALLQVMRELWPGA